uniref:non-ribosomal peptide synthetase n=1 Tax=Paraglaciecola sp. TaxID=1920173 RepID=UPI0030F47845
FDATFGGYSHVSAEVSTSASSLMYVIYTSGSTGKPKGVMVKRQGFRNLINWYIKEFDISSEDNVLITSAIGFDLTQKNMFAPILVGGKLVMTTAPFYQADELMKVIEGKQITSINCAPSTLYGIVDVSAQYQFEPLNTLRIVLLGGESIKMDLLRSWLHSQEGSTQLVNMYGPTECTDISTSGLCDPNQRRNPDIGLAPPYVQLYVLSDRLEPLPVGVPGELVIGGKAVARGYINQPELTAEKFIPNTFSKESNSKMYRTGDLVRRLENNRIEFIGRIDHQVKIRGFRIELGEIEQKLLDCGGIKEVIVLVHEDDSNQTLVAYVLLDALERGKAQVQLIQTYQQYLQSHLPNYMVPSLFVFLDSMPLTPNGKINRKALPQPDLNQILSVYVAPESETEMVITQFWVALLKLDHTDISVNANFFELGGHSLLAMRAVTNIKKYFQVNLTVKDIFELQTIKAISLHVDYLATLAFAQNDGAVASLDEANEEEMEW